MKNLLSRALALCLLALLAGAAGATTLRKADVEKELGARYIVGEMPSTLPVWPLYQRDPASPDQKPQLRGYAFESVDIEPVRGYSGKPINLFILTDTDGNYLDVRLLEHREPLFRSESGTQKIAGFASQYPGLSVRHHVDIRGPQATTQRDGQQAVLRGVQAGTVTARAIDKTVLQSVSTVLALAPEAMANAGKAGGRRIQRRATDIEVRPLEWAQLQSRRMIDTTQLTRAQVEAAFKGTRAAGADADAALRPDEVAIEFHVALVSLPQIGRNLLDDPGWRVVEANLRGGEAIFVSESGPLSDLLRGARGTSLSFTLEQDGKPLQFRQLGVDEGLKLPADLRARHRLFIVDAATPLDVSRAFELKAHLQRRYGPFPTMVADAAFPLAYSFHGWRATLVAWRDSDWFEAWQKRAGEIGLLVAALLLLAVLLLRQRTVTSSARRLNRVRIPFLLFTVGGIGWWFQGQLSIVNITSAVEALASGNDLRFLLTDPMTVILWLAVFVTLLVWGRGTFCGWLCPFGALQELVSRLMRAVGVRHRRLRQAWDRRLKWIKYGVLAVIVGSIWAAPSATELLVEVEPFKTAISLYFVRDWPYLAWALGCIALSVFVYRGYCRYICPLGAALAALNPLRRWGWIPRRDACGQPCQTCRSRCDYQSISKEGKVAYQECFQCLDCVAIWQDDRQCLPLVQEKKRTVIAIVPQKELA